MAKHSPFPFFAFRQISGLVCLACASFAAQSQSVAEQAHDTLVAAHAPTLNEMVVSGSRHEQSSDDLAMSVDVLGAKELERQQVRDIRDAARYLPNVSVKRAPARFGLVGGGSDGRDGNSGFNIRGLDGNRVLLLVDGVRATRSYVFGSNAFGRDSFSVDLLKRIEIVRGPSSVLYGSDALAGLVNFITHEPADFLKDGKTLGGRASAAYHGDDHGLTLSGTVAGRASDELDWLVSVNASRGKELQNLGSNAALNADRTEPNPQTDSNKALLGKFVWRPEGGQKHVVTLEHVEKSSDLDLLTSRSKLPFSATSVVKGDASTRSERSRLSWDARYQLRSAWADQLQTVLSYQKASSRQLSVEHRFAAIDRVRDMTYDEKSWQVGVQADKTFSVSPDWAHKITYGLDHARIDVVNLQTGQVPAAGETFPLKRFPDTRESSSAVYLQDEWMGGQWSITPGVRIERFSLDASQSGFVAKAASLSGSAVSPKLGVLFRATPEWSVFGHYASGFRAPNASQLNGYFENLTQFYKTISNPNLKPEKSKNIEFGVRGRTGPVSVDAAVFSGRFNNLIEDNAVVAGAGVRGDPIVMQSINVGNATIRGFEVKGRVDWGKAGGGEWSTPFGYGQTRGTDKTTGRPLDSIEPAKLHVGLKYEAPTWDIGLAVVRHATKKFSDVATQQVGRPLSPQFVTPAATTLDLSGQWRISKTVRLNAGIANLGNKKYWNWSSVRGVSATSPVMDAYTQPGRHVNVSLVADF